MCLTLKEAVSISHSGVIIPYRKPGLLGLMHPSREGALSVFLLKNSPTLLVLYANTQ